MPSLKETISVINNSIFESLTKQRRQNLQSQIDSLIIDLTKIGHLKQVSDTMLSTDVRTIIYETIQSLSLDANPALYFYIEDSDPQKTAALLYQSIIRRNAHNILFEPNQNVWEKLNLLRTLEDSSKAYSLYINFHYAALLSNLEREQIIET